jgi:hypothetical protein
MSRNDQDVRLDGLARYAVLVARQEAALDAGDVDAFVQCSQERDALQEELDALPPRPMGESPDPAHLADVIEALEQAHRSDCRIRRLVRHRREDARRSLDEMDRRGGQARRYLEAERARPGLAGVDVTS